MRVVEPIAETTGEWSDGSRCYGVELQAAA
jgi:hypothetical protein